MGSNKKVRKQILGKWLLWVFLGWFCSEVIYQFYIHSKWVENVYYKWEDYALIRNRERMKDLDRNLMQFSGKYFIYSENPDLGNIDELPKDIQDNIIDLKNDLIWGISLIRTRKHFEFNYQQIDSNTFIIYIHAGANFKSSYNGYNFDVIITNANASYRDGYESTNLANVYVNKLNNKEYRSTPFLLHYNCNSYDLLILKLFR